MVTFHKRTIRHAVRFKFDADRSFSQFADRVLENLSHEELEGQILRRVLAEVIVPVIRQAYLMGLPKAVDMRVAHRVEGSGGTDSEGNMVSANLMVKGHPRIGSTDATHALNVIYERMRKAQFRGDVVAMQRAQEDLDRAKQPYTEALQILKNKKRKESHWLSSGLFRKRAVQVMEQFVNPRNMGTVGGNGSVTVGIGNVQRLNRIDTPSATEYRLGLGATRSPNKILWRQLEFGTGVHANSQHGDVLKKNRSPFNTGLTDGMWYYGKSLSKARLILEGSDGVHAIYGNPAMVDAMRQFPVVVGQYLDRVFKGEKIF